MRFKHLLVGLATTLSFSSGAAEAPQIKDGWGTIFQNNVGRYEILVDSVKLDPPTLTAQFDFRIVLNKEAPTPNGNVKTIIEHGLVMCKADVYIATNQEQQDVEGKIINTLKFANVYENTHHKNSPISRIIALFCDPDHGQNMDAQEEPRKKPNPNSI